MIKTIILDAQVNKYTTQFSVMKPINYDSD